MVKLDEFVTIKQAARFSDVQASSAGFLRVDRGGATEERLQGQLLSRQLRCLGNLDNMNASIW
jgi:hypothetical protein